jgi:hypothetical protein
MATKNIGFVADLEGVAQIRSVDGVTRILSIGDAIYDGGMLSADPSIPKSGALVNVNPIAGNDIVDIVEAAGSIDVTGRVVKDFSHGDNVSFTVNGTLY